MCFKAKKFISIFLSAAIILSAVNVSVFAEGTEEAAAVEISEAVELTENTDEIGEAEETAEESDVQETEDVVSESETETSEASENIGEEVASEETEDNSVTEEQNIPVIEEINEEEMKQELAEVYEAAVEDMEVSLTSVDTLQGTGTKEDPYLIYTEEELIDFAVGNVTDGLTAYWSLQSDIELTADTWAPIGAYTPFSGVFYGNGHTISSTKLFQSTAMSGIFGQNAGTIQDLNVNVTIEEVATNTGTLCATNTGTIINCTSAGTITTTESMRIGGLVGYNNGGTIINCGSSTVIDAPNSEVGGLVGRNQNGIIKYSYASGEVTGNCVGGLVGYAYNDDANCRSIISNCYSLGKINGGSNAGGLIGYCAIYYYNSGGTHWNGYITIEYCYAKGIITQGDTIGGLTSGINKTDRILIRYSYYNSINVGNYIGFGMSLTEFTDKNNFYDWDFENIWEIEDGGYPYINYKSDEILTIDGDGTAESPYMITNEKQLCYLASEKLPNAFSAYYKLANDIVVTANFWTPIGCDAAGSFSGVFDGNGFSITGVHLENTYYDYYGLFGKNSGIIKNLTVESYFVGNTYTGGLVGYNTGTINNCKTYIEDEDYFIANVSTGNAGGLVGYNNGGIIINSSSSSFVNSPGAKAGGLAGYHKDGLIKYCSATGDVIAEYAGGLIGYVYNTIEDNNTRVNNSYAMGKVTGTNHAGGLIGYCAIYYYNSGGTHWNGYITVDYCYSRGLVTEGTNGGLIGGMNKSDRILIRYSYYNIANTGNKYGFGIKASELKKQSNLYGWNFDNVWMIDSSENTGYPHINLRDIETEVVLQGNGEEDNPYLIHNEYELRALAHDTLGNYDLSVKQFYKLANDIEVSANFWTPIGTDASNSFNGIFDGDGHTISGLKLSNTYYDYVGLFGKVSGTVKNVNVNVEIEGMNYVGGICGFLDGGIIENCNVSGVLTSISTNANVGGIVGKSEYGTITKCDSSASISGEAKYTGGVCGSALNGLIKYCCASGDVSGNYAGGLIGLLYNTDANTDNTVSNSYATGDVSGITNAGGLIGYCQIYYYNSGGTHWNGYDTIEYCYAAGNVTGPTSGGLIGSYNKRDRVRIRYSYYNSVNAGNKIGFAATNGQLKRQDLYYGWNFTNIWAIDSDVNNGLPYHNVNGKIKTHYLDGYGDEDDPYMICTEEDLWALVLETYDLTTKFYYQLQNDIEITAEHWTPIGGNGRTVFNGIFDGNGYTISGLKLSDSEYMHAGLFGQSTGTIKNLNVEVNFEGQDYIGAICGLNQGTIDNCTSSGICSSTLSSCWVGGIAGTNETATITNCSSTVKISAPNWKAGGIAGYSQNSVIKNCYATGDIIGKYAGGIAGQLLNDNSSTNSTISNCYATGNVSGTDYAGGLVGSTNVSNNQGYTTIEYCYSNGFVTSTSKIGGLVGYSNSSTRNSILSSYYNSTVTGLSDIDRGTPLDDASMKLQASYVGWDFTDPWAIDASLNSGYPYLSNLELESVIPVTAVALSADTLTVGLGKSAILTAVVTPTDATNQELKWTSSNEKIVTVADGVVTGLLEGSANIIVTTWDGSFTAECVVTVVNTSTPVTGVTLDKTTLTLEPDASETLTATVLPADATDKSVAWTSSNTSVATVSNGVVTAKSAGTAVITATTADGGYTAACTVTVNAPVATEGKCGDNITWKYENGVLTITGTGAIYDYSSDNDYTTNPPPWFDLRNDITDIKLSEGITRIGDFALVGCVNLTGITLPSTLESIGERAFMDWIKLVELEIPQNVTTIEDGAFEWNDSFTKITIYEGVTSFGTGVFEACANLTIYGITGSTAQTYADANSIPFVSIGSVNIPVTGITLNKSILELYKGDSETLTATVSPSDATDKTVTWTSTNTSVATVSNGVVTAVSAGVAVITATTSDGGYTASCTVTVLEEIVDENAPKISITDIKARPGQEVQVTVALENNTGFASLGIEIGFDDEVFTLTNVAQASGIGGTFMTAPNYLVNPYNISWDNATNITYNGNLATFTFTVKEGAADGIYPITVDYYKGVSGNYIDGEDVNYSVTDDGDFNAVGFVYVNGSVAVTSYTPGDLNGDDKVTNKDVTYLLRYLAKWEVSDLVTEALDIDGSGTVNNKDVTILLRYLAGWDVELK